MSGKKKPEIYAPRIPGGVITVPRLKELVERLEKAGAKEVKLSGELIFILGEKRLTQEEEKSLPYPASRYEIPGVRGVKVCSATTFCNRNLQDVLGLALKLDELYYAVELPMKLTIGLAARGSNLIERADARKRPPQK